MNEHIDDLLLPFYVNTTLPVEQREAVEAHLSVCAQCQAALGEWEDLADMVRSTVPPLGEVGSAGDFPALSPVVQANLRGKPSFPESVLAAASLIGAQRIYLKESWLIQTIFAVLLAGTLASRLLPVDNNLKGVVSFFILVPLLAVLGVVLLEMQADDLGCEIVAATPTHPGVLTFARLTLALGVIAGLALLSSLLSSGFDGASLGGLVLTWLGPMLWLSALTTLLALRFNPWTAAGISFTLWGGIALLLVAGEYGRSLLGFSLTPLLYPSWWFFGVQVLLAGILWFVCWLWLFWGAPPAMRMERVGRLSSPKA
jgi:hypothetical protein